MWRIKTKSFRGNHKIDTVLRRRPMWFNIHSNCFTAWNDNGRRVVRTTRLRVTGNTTSTRLSRKNGALRQPRRECESRGETRNGCRLSTDECECARDDDDDDDTERRGSYTNGLRANASRTVVGSTIALRCWVMIAALWIP